MGLESATTIAALNANWPLGTDPKSQGDDHLRLIKSVMQADVVPKGGGTFTGPVIIGGGAPRSVWQNTAAPADEQAWSAMAQGNGTFTIATATDAAVPASTMLTLTRDGTTGEDALLSLAAPAPEASSLLNRVRGDARYLQKAGDTMTGPLVLGGGAPRSVWNNAAAAANARAWYAMAQGDGTFVIGAASDALAPASAALTFRRSGTSASDVLLNAALLAPEASSLMHRARGDARYALATSDARLKQSVADMGPMLAAVAALRPVTFEWIPDEEDPRQPGEQLGLIAQEVAEVLPQAVYGGDDGAPYKLDALSLIGVLVRAVQELTARLEAVEAR